MTIQTTSSKAFARGNGATTVWPFTFQVPNGQYLQITYTDTLGNQTLLSASLYSVVFSSGFLGGTVTYPLVGSPIAAGTSLTIARVVPFTQLTSLEGQSGFFPQVVEAALDNLTMQIQELAQGVLNTPLALVFPAIDIAPITVLPPAAARVGKYLGFDSSGNPVMLAGSQAAGDLSNNTAIATGSVTARSLGARFGEILNVKDYGAKGDGVTDDTAAFLAAIAALALTNGGMIFAPIGKYPVSATLDFSALNQFHFFGESPSHLEGKGTQIIGNVAGDIIKYVPAGTGNIIKISGLFIENTSTNAAANCINLQNAVGPVIEWVRCVVNGKYGIYCKNLFSARLTGCVIFGARASTIGIFAYSSVTIDTCDVVNCGEGIRCCGVRVDISGCRIEVNGIGLNLGVQDDGSSFLLAASKIHGNSCEANDTAIIVNAMNSVSIIAMTCLGSTNAPSGQSQIAVLVRSSCNYCTFADWNVTGTYSDSAIKVEGGAGTQATFMDCIAVNAFGGGTSSVWNIKASLAGGLTFIRCNYTLRPDDVLTSRVSHDWLGRFQGLQQIDYMNPAVESRNIRGKNLPLGNGVNTLAVAFTSDHSSGFAAINNATAGVAGGGTMAGTFYYVATIVTAHGECGTNIEKVVNVGGGNNSVTLTFFGNTADGFKRRVYRGSASGNYDGYYEMALNSNANYVDLGSGVPFTGTKDPPTNGVDDTSMIEPDNNYAVVVTPSWPTTVSVTGKLTTGFTANFGTVTPDANQTIDWILIR